MSLTGMFLSARFQPVLLYCYVYGLFLTWPLTHKFMILDAVCKNIRLLKTDASLITDANQGEGINLRVKKFQLPDTFLVQT